MAKVYRVRAVEQTLAILDALASEQEMTIPEIGRRIGTQTPNAHKLVLHLVEAGLIEASPYSKRYRLGVRRLGELSTLAVAGLNPWEELRQVVPRLQEATGMPGLIAVLSGSRAVYVEQFRGPARALGRAFPAHATALGKALLAFLPRQAREAAVSELVLDAWSEATITDPEALVADLAVTSERGYAVEDGELDAARRSVAAPVRDHTGAVVAAIGVGGAARSISDAALARIAGDVVAEAVRVSSALGAPPASPHPPRRLEVEVLGAVEPPIPPAKPAPSPKKAPRTRRPAGERQP